MTMLRLLVLLVVIFSCDASPRRYHDVYPRIHKIRRDAEKIPDGIQPSTYKIDLVVLNDTLSADEATFTGIVEISFSVSMGKNFTEFPIHAKEVELNGTPLLTKSDDDTFTSTIAIDVDEANDFWKITSTATLTSGFYVLTISYKGKLSDTDMDGFYRSYYVDEDENLKYLATTQFEQFGARRAFPSFDEPALKASFVVSITYSEGYKVVSNTPEDSTTDITIDGVTCKKTTFIETPSMSTYLIAFIVFDETSFQCIDGATVITPNLENQICARSETESLIQTALDVAPKALEAMNYFTSISYNSMNVGKMTQAAIPDFAAGAMENWGLVTYREVDILWDPEQSSNYYHQIVATVVTHEFAHQWFGDKVTLDWWTNIFLNEGFATYFEYHATERFEDQWELTKQFVLEQVQPVLVTDSSPSSLPLSYATNDPDVIMSRFDDISYNKGGTIFRMVQHFVGINLFRTGLNSYLGKQPIGVVNELWGSFQDVVDQASFELPETVPNIMESWTYKAGYPVLTVSLADDGRSVTVRQNRFLLSGTDEDKTQWYVPITYSTDKTPDFEKTDTQGWLLPGNNLTIPLDADTQWIVLNNQQVGYYRVKYDDQLLAKISTALNDDLTTIDEISRSQIVDDLYNFARADVQLYPKVLAFIKFLKKDDSYYTWYAAFNGFKYVLKRTNNANVKNALKNDIKELTEALAKVTSINITRPEEQIYTLRQVLALQWACDLDLNGCPAEARRRFVEYTSDDANILDPNLKALVYCNGLRQSNDSTKDFNFLYNKYLTSDLATEQITILKALGCVNDATLRVQYLEKALSDEVRLQDVRYVFQSVYANNPNGVDDVLTFIKKDYALFENHFGGQSQLISLVYNIADLFTTQAQINSLNAFLAISGLDPTVKTEGAAAAEAATNNLNRISSVEQVLKSYYKINDGKSKATNNNIQIVILAIIPIITLMFK